MFYRKAIFVLTSSTLIKRLWQEHIVFYKKRFIIALFCMLCAALSTAALPYLLKPVFDDVFSNGTPQTLILFCGAVFGAFVVKGFAGFGEAVSMNYIGQKIISDLQKRLFRHIITSDLRFFHGHSTGHLISHFTNDVNVMRNAVAHTITGIGKDSLTLLLLVALMLYRDLTLSLATCLIFPLIFYPIIRLGKRLRRVSHSTQDYLGDLTGLLSQLFQGIRVVKAYHAEHYEINRINKNVQKIFHYLQKASITRSLSHPIVETVGGFSVMGVIGYGGYQVMNGMRTTGEFVSFMGALILIYEPMKRLSNMNANLQEGLAAAKRIYAVLDIHPTICESSSPTPLNEQRRKGEIAFEHVSFAYNDCKNVLENIHFKVPAGNRIAFVGPSGAGKSTLINLLPRFYDPTMGRVLIDSVDVRSYSFKDLRDYMALVSQEIVLFNDSVAANVAYPNTEIDLKRVKEASLQAAADEFIRKLEKGYDTLIGENGQLLSGGQRQRIALARAIYKNAPILLLDEATSALDSESERVIQHALQTVTKERTTLIVAHRLSTIKDADTIYVLDKGKIIEHGDHTTLLKKGGLYADLWSMQGNGG